MNEPKKLPKRIQDREKLREQLKTDIIQLNEIKQHESRDMETLARYMMDLSGSDAALIDNLRSKIVKSIMGLSPKPKEMHPQAQKSDLMENKYPHTKDGKLIAMYNTHTKYIMAQEEDARNYYRNSYKHQFQVTIDNAMSLIKDKMPLTATTLLDLKSEIAIGVKNDIISESSEPQYATEEEKQLKTDIVEMLSTIDEKIVDLYGEYGPKDPLPLELEAKMERIEVITSHLLILNDRINKINNRLSEKEEELLTQLPFQKKYMENELNMLAKLEISRRTYVEAGNDLINTLPENGAYRDLNSNEVKSERFTLFNKALQTMSETITKVERPVLLGPTVDELLAKKSKELANIPLNIDKETIAKTMPNPPVIPHQYSNTKATHEYVVRRSGGNSRREVHSDYWVELEKELKKTEFEDAKHSFVAEKLKPTRRASTEELKSMMREGREEYKKTLNDPSLKNDDEASQKTTPK